MKLILDTPTHKIEIPDGATIGPPKFRRIATKAFFRRLKFAERKVLRDSTADTVVDLREDLQRSTTVDLDGILRQQLLDTTLLSPARIAQLLVDGSSEEVLL